MEDEAPKFELKIEGAGLSLSRTVDGVKVRTLLHIVLGGSGILPFAPPASAGSGLGVAPVVGANASTSGLGARTSLREYLTGTGAKRNPDKILVIADYLERHEGVQGFTREDIKGRFRSAGESPPGNYPRDFNWALTNGWIAEDPSARGQYYVTRTGQSAIEAGFSLDVIKGSKQKSGRRRRGGRIGDDSGGEE